MIPLLAFLLSAIFNCYGQCPPCTNQTDYLTVPLQEDALPYRVALEQADFTLPQGLHSFAYAIYKGEWLLIAGRTNGLHDVNNTDPNSNSFPTSEQNTIVYVVNPTTKSIHSALSTTHHPIFHKLKSTFSLSQTLYFIRQKINRHSI